jgi:hypothetical protein
VTFLPLDFGLSLGFGIRLDLLLGWACRATGSADASVLFGGRELTGNEMRCEVPCEGRQLRQGLRIGMQAWKWIEMKVGRKEGSAYLNPSQTSLSQDEGEGELEREKEERAIEVGRNARRLQEERVNILALEYGSGVEVREGRVPIWDRSDGEQARPEGWRGCLP